MWAVLKRGACGPRRRVPPTMIPACAPRRCLPPIRVPRAERGPFPGLRRGPLRARCAITARRLARRQSAAALRACWRERASQCGPPPPPPKTCSAALRDCRQPCVRAHRARSCGRVIELTYFRPLRNRAAAGPASARGGGGGGGGGRGGGGFLGSFVTYRRHLNYRARRLRSMAMGSGKNDGDVALGQGRPILGRRRRICKKIGAIRY